MLAVTFAVARTELSLRDLTDKADSSVKIMMEESGRQVASDDRAMNERATSNSSSLAAPARRNP
jgi:hypothetical protein